MKFQASCGNFRRLCLLLMLCVAGAARAEITGMVSGSGAFESTVDLTDIRLMCVQSNQTIKTFDTFARDAMFGITANRAKAIKGRDAAFVVLDMAMRPQEYLNANLIYIRAIPFREDFSALPMIGEAEKKRIKEDGTISLNFWLEADVRRLLSANMTTIKGQALNQIDSQASQLAQLLGFPEGQRALYGLAILPPIDAPDANAKPWTTAQTVVDAAATSAQNTAERPTSIGGYSLDTTRNVLEGLAKAQDGWLASDAGKAKEGFAQLASATAGVNPDIYPTLNKRKFELSYNRLFRLTLPGATLYFVGFVLFLLAWKTEGKWLYRSAVGFTIAAWLVHALGIAVRWWLVQKNVGNWFEAIPIKNQFESVLMSAFLGVTVALGLEWWKKLGIFGAAAAGVGALSLIAIFSAPYISARDIGGEIHQNAGILMTYWLYVHVTMVTASYALIGMTFVMGVWYIVQYLKDSNAAVLRTIDDCNLVMLQLAFWILGTGIICGALWADVSWGRPWGWDPKETFALVTWIVYLIIIHVRFVTSGNSRALTTGILSIVGFGVMLFNWIGVNFFLVGLHSYA